MFNLLTESVSNKGIIQWSISRIFMGDTPVVEVTFAYG